VTCLKRAAAQSESAGSKLHRSATEMSSGTVLFCLGDLGGALRSFQRAADLYEGIGRGPAHCLNAMGRVQLARGDRGRAVDCFREAAGAMGRFQADSLAGLEEALGDEPESYRAWCAQAHDGHADVAPGRWYLEPAEPHAGHGETTRMDCCAATVPPEWRWVDPIGECRFELDDGLVLHAANGRGLRDINRSAPRLVTEIDGDFALEAVCAPASEAMPSIGGLLIWCDEKNYLRLDKGARGEHEINFSGAVGNEDMCIGRGLLCVERAFLRLERNGGHVVALCSPDGREWLTAGDVRFDIESPILVGVHAIGEIDPTVYPGAFPEGTAIRFKSFDMWGQPPAV
jgi:hypothetical protein